MNRAEKEQLVEKLRNDFGKAKSIIMTNHAGIDVTSVNELRSEFRAACVEYHVIKNTLARLAVQDTDLEVLADHFRGPTAVAYSFEDAVAPAKVAVDFAEDNETYELKGGFLNGSIIENDKVKALSEMPSKDELRGKLLNVFQAAPTKFVRLLNAAPKNFINVLNARKNDIEDAA